LDAADICLEGTTVANATFQVPELSPAGAALVAEAVREAAFDARRHRSIAEVVDVVSRAAERLADPTDRFGRLAASALQTSGGWTEQEAADLLESSAAGWTAEALWRVLRGELDDPAVLDSPQAVPGRQGLRRRAVGSPVLFLVLSGNVPGIAVTAVIRALLVRSAVLCKLPKDEPDLVGLFARALHEEAPDLAASIAATWWPADSPGAAASEWTKRSGKVVVYGGDAAVRAVRDSTPTHIQVIEYGPRLGIACLGADASDADLAALARDVCAYDQAGCVSPRLVYVLGDFPAGSGPMDTIERFTQTLSTTAPGPSSARVSDSEAAALRGARASYQFTDGEGKHGFGADDLSWTVLFQDGAGVYSENLPRAVWAYRVSSVDELRGFGRVLEGRVQAVAAAGLDPETRGQIEDLAVEWGVARVAPVGEMAWPPADWRHNGQMQLQPLLNWTDFE
jgi:hypothetical protein